MIKSMTGFGRAETCWLGKKLIVEVKSLNHRYLEINLRTPPLLSAFEWEIKKRIATLFSRGKIEVVIRIDGNSSCLRSSGVELNMTLLKSYYELLCRIKEELNLEEKITLGHLMAFRDVFTPCEEPDVETMNSLLFSALEEATRGLTEMREKEGESLAQMLMERMGEVARIVSDIEKRGPQALKSYQSRLRERIRELLAGSMIDENRLIQEVAIMAEKTDIMEEIVRLRSHMEQFLALLHCGEAVGRKMDFLIQEMGREVNTIGAKSSDLEISRAVIELKSELTKIREQVQNIE